MLVNYPIQHLVTFDENNNATVELTCQTPFLKSEIEEISLNLILDISDLNQPFPLSPNISINQVNKKAKIKFVLTDFNILQLAPEQFQIYDLTNMSMFQISLNHKSEKQIINLPVYCYLDQNSIKFEIFDP